MFTLVQPPRQEDQPTPLAVRRQVVDEFLRAVRAGTRAQVFILLRELPELVLQSDDQGYLPMHLAAKTGDAGLLQMLVEHGADINAMSSNEERVLPLHSAAYEGKIASMRYLLNQGADINAQDANGFTPLICAAKSDRPEAVIFLHQVLYQSFYSQRNVVE